MGFDRKKNNLIIFLLIMVLSIQTVVPVIAESLKFEEKELEEVVEGENQEELLFKKELEEEATNQEENQENIKEESKEDLKVEEINLENRESKGRDLKGIGNFNYDNNLYIDGEEIEAGSTIEIEDLTILNYKIEFNLEDDFDFINGDYLSLDIASLSNLNELDIKNLEGRIIFNMDDKEIDGGKYYISQDNKLEIVFDKGESLKDYKGRKGFVDLEFTINKTEDEVEIIEEIVLEGKETKKFIIKRSSINTTSIEKDGSYNEDKDNIEWTIDINKDLSILENVKVIDLLPQGLIVEKIEIADLKISKKANDVIEREGEFVELSRDEYTVNDENEISIELGNLAREAKRIKLTTSMDKSINGKVNLKNKARLESKDNIPKETEKELEFSRNTGIEKTAKIKGNEIEWTISFRGDSNEGTSSIEDILEFPEGIKLVLKDNITLNGEEYLKENIEFDNKKITFNKIPNSTEIQTLVYKTKVIFENNGEGPYEIKNTASYKKNEASSSVKINKRVVASKDNGAIYGDNEGNTFIDWQIRINSNNEDWKNVSIIEYIPEGFEFEGVRDYNNELTFGFDDTNPREIKITIDKEISEEKIIIVTLKLVDKDVADKNVVNKALVKWQVSGDNEEKVIGGTIGDGWYEKEVSGEFNKDWFISRLSKSNKGIDYENREITWGIRYVTFIETVEGIEIRDSLEGKQNYIKNSLILTLNTSEYEIKEIGQGLVVKAKNTEDELNYDLSFNKENNNFILKINSGNISEKYNDIHLEYKTKVNLSEIEDSEKVTLENKVKISNKGKDLEADSKVELTEKVSNNGSKTVSKEEGKNRVFNWEVKLNYKGKKISKDKEIIDLLTGKQRYIEDTIKIYRAKLDKNGNLVKVNEELNEDSDYTIEFTKKEEEIDPYYSGMIIKFNEDLDTPIILEYQTEAVGISEEKYTNKISYNAKDYKAEIGYKDYKEFISKKVLNDRNGKVVKGDILEWELKVNKSLSEIHDFKLTDTMSDGLILIEDSIEVYKDGKKVSGDFDKFKVDILKDKNGFILYKKLIDNEYTIKYKTLVSGDKEVKEISNDVGIVGKNFESKLEKESKYSVVGRSEAGGTGYKDKNYTVKIVKVNAINEAIRNNHAKFKLITETRINEDLLIAEEELKTNDLGQIVLQLEKNEYNKYYIQEIEAPEGYLLSEEKIEIVLGEDKEIETRIKNIEKTEVSVEKEWINGPSPRPTIEIQLFRKIENGYLEKVGDTIELKDGETKYIWKDLEKTDGEGKEYIYSVDELGVPENYGKKVDGFKISNEYESPKTEITGRKIWSGGPSPRPTIELQLYRNNEKYLEPIKLKDGATEYTWENLDRTDKEGKEYVYSVDEEEVPENYEKKIEGYTITNNYISPKTEITGKKVWEGGSKNRPTIEIQLYREVKGSKKEEVGEKIKLKDGETEYTWKDLDETDKDGKKYIYTIDEVKVPTDYDKSILKDGLTIVNKYNPNLIDPGKPIDPKDPEATKPITPTKPEEEKDKVTNEEELPEESEIEEDLGENLEEKEEIKEKEISKDVTEIESKNSSIKIKESDKIKKNEYLPKTGIVGFKEMSILGIFILALGVYLSKKSKEI